MVLEQLSWLLTSPLLLLTLSIIALIFSATALSISLSSSRKVSLLEEGLAPISSGQQGVTVAEPRRSGVQEEAKPRVEEGVVRVSGGVESLQEIAYLLGVDTVFLFNLSGMAIESHGMKNEDEVAASLAEIIHTLNRHGFPTDNITLKDGANTTIISVKKVGDMEIYALMVGKDTPNVEEARRLLDEYLTNLTRGGRS